MLLLLWINMTDAFNKMNMLNNEQHSLLGWSAVAKTAATQRVWYSEKQSTRAQLMLTQGTATCCSWNNFGRRVFIHLLHLTLFQSIACLLNSVSRIYTIERETEFFIPVPWERNNSEFKTLCLKIQPFLRIRFRCHEFISFFMLCFRFIKQFIQGVS